MTKFIRDARGSLVNLAEISNIHLGFYEGTLRGISYDKGEDTCLLMAYPSEWEAKEALKNFPQGFEIIEA